MLQLGDLALKSRLIVGTGRYASFDQMQACHEASGTGLVTVAVRRVDLAAAKGEGILDYIDREAIALLPNTSGCYTAEDAVMTAQLAREAFGTRLVKVEVIGCDRTLFPDPEGTLEASRILVSEGFTVLPYCGDDPVLCQQLEDIGCAAVMPLAAPIGSGLGLRDTSRLQIIRELVDCPVIVDAGIGTPSDAVRAMELGADAILLNTAIAAAGDPVAMATAFRLAVESGRLAHEAGRMPMKLYATASSPLDGRIA